MSHLFVNEYSGTLKKPRNTENEATIKKKLNEFQIKSKDRTTQTYLLCNEIRFCFAQGFMI